MQSLEIKNIYQVPQGEISAELFEVIAQQPGVKIEKIVSRGQSSPAGFWYDQEQTEWVLLLKGRARIQFEDNFVDLYCGDHITIQAHQKHRVAWTAPNEDTIWLAVFY